MQDRYAGDVGDFGKLGLLRILDRKNLKIGINWYHVPDEKENGDGRHIGYLHDSQFRGCDDELLMKMNKVVKEGKRTIEELEKQCLIRNACYFGKPLYSPNSKYITDLKRSDWNVDALSALKNTDIVFLDPDNGLLVKSVSPRSAKSNKYIFSNELIPYYVQGKSVIFYNHRCRQPEDEYIMRFAPLQMYPQFEGATWKALKFKRGTLRDYIMIIQPQHVAVISDAIEHITHGSWGRHFSELNLHN